MTKRIQELAEGLSHNEIRHPYLDDLQTRAAARKGKGGIEAVQQEILREMADAYSRSQRRVDTAFERLASLEGQIAQVSQTSDRAASRQLAELTVAFNDQRDRAAQRLWELRVHRDALGFAHSDELGRKYPLPPRRKAPPRPKANPRRG